jgi:hypothetical protein
MRREYRVLVAIDEGLEDAFNVRANGGGVGGSILRVCQGSDA